jgi:hypothetical protein
MREIRRGKRPILALLLLLTPLLAFSQTFSRGAVLDPVLYDSLPQRAVQLSRAYESLPQTVSLKQYAPNPGNQNPYGTCAAWASAYAARTILESISLNRRDRQQSTANVFSPNFVYKSMFVFNNQPDDPNGERGASVAWALTFMRDRGPVKMLDQEKQTDFRNIPLSLFANSRAYPIAEYATLFRSNQGSATKIQMVKKSLAESKPVIIGMKCPDSFVRARGDTWRPTESPAGDYGGHALCVVGYDDAKAAFEVQNSWGANWGNAGFIWIPYDVFSAFVFEAYEISENLANFSDTVKYSGFARIVVRGASDMAVTYLNGYYQTLNSYSSGMRFRYLLGNDEPAYVYAFAADETGADPTSIFPLEGVSPLLDYTENVIAFPGEFNWIELDDRAGTDYLVVLYSKKALNITAIRDQFAREQGSFSERVARAVGSDYIPSSQTRYESNRLAFAAVSANPNAVFGLLLAIKHQ